MSDIQESAALPEASQPPAAPEDLPPVQPPSAGFIMQLFLIPAIIVAAVIGVWVLFGRMAGAEQDWRQLVQDLGSENEHRRWRAASGLAHMLNADRQRSANPAANGFDSPEPTSTTPGEEPDGPLATNPDVASELVKLFSSQLDSRSTKDEDVTHQEFLARTLGSLDLPDVVLPSLQKATQPDYDEKVRASALTSIANVVSRANTQNADFDSDELVRTLIDSSGDQSVLVRQFSAYTLGLLPVESSLDHLVVMLSDADEKTRVNAAIGLARNDRTDGLDVFGDVLVASLEKLDKSAISKLNDEERMEALNRYQIEQPMMLNNTLRALSSIGPKLSADQKTKIAGQLKPIASSYDHQAIRKDAQLLIDKLK
jgi:HEAT repeat protein